MCSFLLYKNNIILNNKLNFISFLDNLFKINYLPFNIFDKIKFIYSNLIFLELSYSILNKNIIKYSLELLFGLKLKYLNTLNKKKNKNKKKIVYLKYYD